MREQYFYLEFSIGSAIRFERLFRLFTALKLEKDQNLLPESGDEVGPSMSAVETRDWSTFLDEPAVEWFGHTFDYNSEEGKTYQALWSLTEPRVRLSHPMFVLPGNWSFDATVEALLIGDYHFINLVQEKKAKGVLYYDPCGWPFGGTEAMAALIEAFGHTVTFDSYHEGPHPRRLSAWNYGLAKQLVSVGHGFMGMV